MVSALCAPAMLLSESAVDTLAKNSLIGSFELVVDELFELVSLSTSARYFLAEVVSPDLIEENKPVRALSSGLWLRLEELDVDDSDEAESSARSEELLVIAEIDMDCNPSWANFSEPRPRSMDTVPRYMCDCNRDTKSISTLLQMSMPIPHRGNCCKAILKWDTRRRIHGPFHLPPVMPIGHGRYAVDPCSSHVQGLRRLQGK